MLESGLPNPGRADSGWLNRALGGLEPEARVRRDGRAFAVGPVTPLVVRGPTPVMSWTPQRIQPASEDTMARLIDLYHHTDTELARAIEGRRDLDDAWRARAMPATMAPTEGQPMPQGFAAQVRAYFAEAAGTAAKFLARADGPRIGALAFNGWDTHIDEGADSGRLATLLGALDGALAAVEKNMGEAWRETVVAVVTEFGRTARINGTNGTDHGTGTIALLAGGALKGGRVIADWPGLKNANLYEGRDLAATTDLRAVLKGLLKDHLRVTDQALAAQRVPGQRRREADGGAVRVTDRVSRCCSHVASLMAAVLAAGLCAARANGVMSEEPAGGIVFRKTDTIAIASEELFLSMDQVRVNYVYQSKAPATQNVTISFPMPEVEVDDGPLEQFPVRHGTEGRPAQLHEVRRDGRRQAGRAAAARGRAAARQGRDGAAEVGRHSADLSRQGPGSDAARAQAGAGCTDQGGAVREAR